jgi:hypothetical protein
VRVCVAWRTLRRESAWDQSPEAILSYLNPLAHIPILEEFLPVFSNAVPKRAAPETEPAGAEGVDPEVMGSQPYSGGSYTSSTGYPKN